MIVSCSWDDGTNDEAVVRVFRKLGLAATFFPCVWGLRNQPPELYQGFEVGNHTLSHAIATHRTCEELVKDIRDMEVILLNRLGVKPEGFAFPYGAVTEELHRQVIGLGYSYTRGVAGHVESVSFLGPNAKYGAASFWDVYDRATGWFVFWGHAEKVDEFRLYADLKRMRDDGCVFITHREFMRMRQLL